ncbi:MAG: hypothetical protein F8N36_05615 [Desulfovibrio sp.]|uniref:hypothetical protein n=1 Tax=Desulfovibrio sp. TaxID=885 RepID=UPI00135D3CEB|nr:hypothetical protein [Desulfovibrio sp.]MTJ92325.1 hypothetical protein [Desulfovibrio sp.]
MSALKIMYVGEKNCIPVRLYFINRQSLMQNILCDIINVDLKKIILKSDKKIIPDTLHGEKCSVYIKIPNTISKTKLKIKNTNSFNCFLCNSYVIKNTFSRKNNCSYIEVATPDNFIEKQLQRHERVYVTKRMVKEIGLWFCADTISDVSELGIPNYCCSENESDEKIRVVNISAGGVRIEIDQVCDVVKLKESFSKKNVLKLILYKTLKKELEIIVVCRCVNTHYSIQAKRLTLFLCFTHHYYDSTDNIGWKSVGKDGIHCIIEWIEDDFYNIIEKQKSIPQELCSRLDLNPCLVQKK